jgi:hypothetical protein
VEDIAELIRNLRHGKPMWSSTTGEAYWPGDLQRSIRRRTSWPRVNAAVSSATASGGWRSIRYNIAAKSRTNLAVPMSGGGREPNANGTRNRANSGLGVVAL